MSDFDATTKKKANLHAYGDEEREGSGWIEVRSFTAGRNSVKPSLEIALRALEEINKLLTCPAAEYVPVIPESWNIIQKAIAEIKKRGDYCG